jgi:hypothetical protein
MTIPPSLEKKSTSVKRTGSGRGVAKINGGKNKIVEKSEKLQITNEVANKRKENASNKLS